MKKQLIIILLFLFSPILAVAYDLNGSMTDNGDGTYSVTVQNNSGHEYNGEAIGENGNTLEVTVEDYNGQSYSGTATKESDNEYALNLQNNSSGGTASGGLTLDD